MGRNNASNIGLVAIIFKFSQIGVILLETHNRIISNSIPNVYSGLYMKYLSASNSSP